MKRATSGLTLVELLIAIGILALLALAATTLLGSSLNNQGQLRKNSASLENLGLSMTLLRRDLEQMLDRAGRDEYGTRQPAPLLSYPEGELIRLEFTRDGRRLLPGEGASSSLERVRYAFEDDNLVRYSAAVPDPLGESAWRKQVLVENIDGVTFTFFDGERWQRQWPPELATSAGLPLVVSLRLDTDRWGVVETFARTVGAKTAGANTADGGATDEP